MKFSIKVLAWQMRHNFSNHMLSSLGRAAVMSNYLHLYAIEMLLNFAFDCDLLNAEKRNL